MPTRVAIDAMGGDHAPSVVIEGTVRVVREHPDTIAPVLVGPESVIAPLLKQHDPDGALGIRVHHAPDVIGMDESPATAIKTKTGSSIHVGIGLCKAGAAQAFVSAGNTGAVMGASLFLLGRINGISRPSVIGYYPTLQGTCILLDVGANVDCKPEHLVQFAWMGRIYAQRVLGVENPQVALMNIGEEPGKGNETAKLAHEALTAATGLGFVGNIEGRDLLRHAADVVVCDGFVGNILLKFGESVASVLPRMIGAEMVRLGMPAEEQAIVAKALKGVKDRFDYEEYGGMPLLGVDGNVIIGHGGSSAHAVKNMILSADALVRNRVTESIAKAVDVA